MSEQIVSKQIVSKQIAIVDDEEEMECIYQLLLEKQIKEELIELCFFSDPLKFMTWLNTHTPHLILTDINMPDLDGPSLMIKIKQSKRSIPTYFISGHHESEFQHIMEQLGVTRFLSKPLDFSKLLNVIEIDLGIFPKSS